MKTIAKRTARNRFGRLVLVGLLFGVAVIIVSLIVQLWNTLDYHTQFTAALIVSLSPATGVFIFGAYNYLKEWGNRDD